MQDDPTLDSKHGVLGRVSQLGENYWTWIHQPYEGTLRFFLTSLREEGKFQAIRLGLPRTSDANAVVVGAAMLAAHRRHFYRYGHY